MSMSETTAIGIDVGGTQIRAARVSTTGAVLDWVALPTAPEPAAVVAQMRDLLHRLDRGDVSAIGVGVPGRVDTQQGRILSGGYVDLAGHSLAQSLGETKRSVVIDNDGNMAMLAEHAIGAARGTEAAVLFTIGTGIGGAVIASGRLLRGRMSAGQLGHLAVDHGGARCLCGRRGCVETLSSGTALRRHIAAAGLPDSTAVETLLAQATDRSSTARRVLDAWAAPMRDAIDTAVAAFDPEVVVLGGGLGAAMHRALAEFPAEAPWYQCRLEPARLDDRAGVIGAGLSALAQHKQRALASA
jgi:glucokinase